MFAMNDAPALPFSDPKSQSEYYRARAEEVRKRAGSIGSAAFRSRFLQIADTYDRLALAEERASKERDATRTGS
jgi:hypothetical protein